MYIDAPPPASHSLPRWIAWGPRAPFSQCCPSPLGPTACHTLAREQGPPEALFASVYLCAVHPKGRVRAAVCALRSGWRGKGQRGGPISPGQWPRGTLRPTSLPCALRNTLPKTPQFPCRKLRGHVYPFAEFGVPQPAACRNWPDPLWVCMRARRGLSWG